MQLISSRLPRYRALPLAGLGYDPDAGILDLPYSPMPSSSDAGASWNWGATLNNLLNIGGQYLVSQQQAKTATQLAQTPLMPGTTVTTMPSGQTTVSAAPMQLPVIGGTASDLLKNPLVWVLAAGGAYLLLRRKRG